MLALILRQARLNCLKFGEGGRESSQSLHKSSGRKGFSDGIYDLYAGGLKMHMVRMALPDEPANVQVLILHV